jgi:hypothetical protein
MTPIGHHNSDEYSPKHFLTHSHQIYGAVRDPGLVQTVLDNQFIRERSKAELIER